MLEIHLDNAQLSLSRKTALFAGVLGVDMGSGSLYSVYEARKVMNMGFDDICLLPVLCTYRHAQLLCCPNQPLNQSFKRVYDPRFKRIRQVVFMSHLTLFSFKSIRDFDSEKPSIFAKLA